MSKEAKELIQNERQRQIEKEGWTIEHDDSHINCELSKAARCYFYYADDNEYTDLALPPEAWPWATSWWKPKNQLADFIRAGALYRAELERLERIGGAVGQKLTNLRLGIKQCEIKIDEVLLQRGLSSYSTPNVPLIALNEAAEIATTDRFKHSCVSPSGQLLYKEGYMTAQQFERSKLPQIIKEVLKRAADQMTFIYHDGFNKTDNRVVHAQFGIDHVRVDKQSILNVDCDDLIK